MLPLDLANLPFGPLPAILCSRAIRQRFAVVAQSVERRTRNAQVMSSSLINGSQSALPSFGGRFVYRKERNPMGPTLSCQLAAYLRCPDVKAELTKALLQARLHISVKPAFIARV